MANELRRTVVVFGGTSGIGAAAAAEFVRLGASVTIVGRDRDRADAVAARIGATGVAVDARDRAALDRFFADLSALDDLVVTISGGDGAGQFSTLDLTALQRGITDKVIAQLAVVQAALPKISSCGSITLVTAASSRAALPGTAGLAAINGALDAAVPVLAAELAPIRVNAVSPGVVDTPWWDRFGDAKSDILASSGSASPLGRVGDAADVGALIVAVARTSFMTGAVVAVDGGVSLAAGTSLPARNA